jgi:hypothetical protein
MGRCIYSIEIEKNNFKAFVYKYCFAIQESEMHRIFTEYNIGKYKKENFEELNDVYTEEEIKEMEEVGEIKEMKEEGVIVEINDILYIKSEMDKLELIYEDIEKLENVLQKKKEFETLEKRNNSYLNNYSEEITEYKNFCKKTDILFFIMIKTMIKYMKKNKKTKYIFMSEI